MPNVSLPTEHENGSAPASHRPPVPAGVRLKRPRGPLRHYGGFLSPSAAAAMPLLLERNRPQRLRRLAATVSDGVVQRRRPTRAADASPHRRARRPAALAGGAGPSRTGT